MTTEMMLKSFVGEESVTQVGPNNYIQRNDGPHPTVVCHIDVVVGLMHR